MEKLKIPRINWEPFDKNNPPMNLCYEQTYLILLREDWHRRSNERKWRYHVDVATAYGSYLDDFWNTENDWDEGQLLEVLAYAELPYCLSEEDLVEINSEE